MEFERGTLEYQKKQEKIISGLVKEGVTGVTKMDTLSSSGRCFFCTEAEVMYFKAMRNFFENSISKRVMTRNQDVPCSKVLTKTKTNLNKANVH